MAGFAGNLIEHIDEVKEKDDSGGVVGVGKETIDEGLGGVDDKISSAGNGDTKLAIWKEIFNDLVMEGGHQEGAREAT